MLLHALYDRSFTASLNRLPRYITAEIVMTSLLLLLLLTQHVYQRLSI